MNLAVQRACVWSIVLVVISVGGGVFGIAGFFPPVRPDLTAPEIAAFYQENAFRIRAGLLVGMMGSLGIMTFAATISEQMKRIPGTSPILERCQFAAGGTAQMVLANIVFFEWLTASYRAGRLPELIQLFSDMGWMIIVGLTVFATLQSIVIGVAVLSDRSPEPVFPKWVAYLNFLGIGMYALADFIVFFKTGPFAWNGFMAFYVSFGYFAIWIVLMMTVLLRAIDRQTAQASVVKAPAAFPPHSAST